MREVYSMETACGDCADALRGRGDYSPTTIRCTINDLLDAADKDGMWVRHDYNQEKAIKRVQSLLKERVEA